MNRRMLHVLALLAAVLCGPLAAQAQTITNTATVAPPAGIDDPTPGNNTDSASVTRLLPSITLEKVGQKISGSPGNGIAAGDVIQFSFTALNDGQVTLIPPAGQPNIVVTDPFPGLVGPTCPATTQLGPGQSMVCTATYTVTANDVPPLGPGVLSNTATVTARTAGNETVSDTGSSTIPSSAGPSITLLKGRVGAGTLSLGSTVDYSFGVANNGSVPLNPVVLNDPLPGLSAIGCDLDGNGTADTGNSFALAVGERVNCFASYTVTQADVDRGFVENTATVLGDTPPGTTVGGVPVPQVSANATMRLPTVARTAAITLTKTGGGVGASPLPSPLVAGAVVEYEFVATNTGNVSLNPVSITDPMPGLSAIACGGVSSLAPAASMSCTATYTVTSADVVAGQLVNTASVTGTPPAGLDNVSATDTETLTLHQEPAITLNKTVNPGPDPVAGDTVVYSFEVTNSGTAALTNVTVTDPLPGLSAVLCEHDELMPNQVMFCEASYVVQPADVTRGHVDNTATATGTPPSGPAVNAPDSVRLALVRPAVTVSKRADAPATPVPVAQTLTYTLTVNVANVPTRNVLTLTDTLGPGLSFGAVTAAGAFNCSGALVCTLPAGTPVGSYALSYTALVNGDAVGSVRNTLVATGPDAPVCTACTTDTPVSDELLLRLSKAAQPREVRIGDFVRYTVTIENLGDNPIEGFTLVDTPPPGFGFVENSLTVDDRDDAGVLAGTQPLRVERLDVEVGGRVTVGYLLRVGAGVRHGEYVNTAIARYGARTLSNQGTARVRLIADPLTEESLLLGTVFDDRDGDGWQDSAALSGVSVRGGFAPGAYVARSTTLDRGDGPRPLADASAPLLHGLSLGDIAGRQSEADAGRRVVISQLLSSPEFTGDFVLQSAQGHRLRMDAAGRTQLDTEGEAAGGRSAAMPMVQRRLARVDGGYRVDYVIGNAGVDERGIPGVRIASVEGLLVETDAFGRYHLAGIDGGRWERGRNLVLKVDPVTLPPGARFTTRNPLLRRVTPGLPVRMDFGVQLPPGRIGGGMGEVEMGLGEVLFDAGSARLREPYRLVVERMAARVREHGGGEVVIAADGETQALAYDRARAVREALLEQLPAELARALSVSLRADAADPSTRLLTLGDAVLLGTVLFDTDRAGIQPAFEPVIAKIAADLEARGGGVVAVIGHADRRGSEAHNDALGLRRAKAVYEAIAARLGPEARARLKVEISEDPRAPTGLRGRRGGATE